MSKVKTGITVSGTAVRSTPVKLKREMTQTSFKGEISKEDAINKMLDERANDTSNPKMSRRAAELQSKINNNEIDLSLIELKGYQQKPKQDDKKYDNNRVVLGVVISEDGLKKKYEELRKDNKSHESIENEKKTREEYNKKLPDLNDLVAIVTQSVLIQGDDVLLDNEKGAATRASNKAVVSSFASKLSTESEKEPSAESHIFAVAKSNKSQDKNDTILYDPSNVTYSATKGELTKAYEDAGINVRPSVFQGTKDSISQPYLSADKKGNGAYRRSCEDGSVLLAYALDEALKDEKQVNVQKNSTKDTLADEAKDKGESLGALKELVQIKLADRFAGAPGDFDKVKNKTDSNERATKKQIIFDAAMSTSSPDAREFARELINLSSDNEGINRLKPKSMDSLKGDEKLESELLKSKADRLEPGDIKEKTKAELKKILIDRGDKIKKELGKQKIEGLYDEVLAKVEESLTNQSYDVPSYDDIVSSYVNEKKNNPKTKAAKKAFKMEGKDIFGHAQDKAVELLVKQDGSFDKELDTKTREVKDALIGSTETYRQYEKWNSTFIIEEKEQAVEDLAKKYEAGRKAIYGYIEDSKLADGRGGTHYSGPKDVELGAKLKEWVSEAIEDSLEAAKTSGRFAEKDGFNEFIDKTKDKFEKIRKKSGQDTASGVTFDSAPSQAQVTSQSQQSQGQSASQQNAGGGFAQQHQQGAVSPSTIQQQTSRDSGVTK